jgi:hypothetical protein
METKFQQILNTIDIIMFLVIILAELFGIVWMALIYFGVIE